MVVLPQKVESVWKSCPKKEARGKTVGKYSLVLEVNRLGLVINAERLPEGVQERQRKFVTRSVVAIERSRAVRVLRKVKV
jgi:hypothetical protein